MGKTTWTEEESQILYSKYPEGGPLACSELTRFSDRQIARRAHTLGIKYVRKNQKPETIQFFIDNYKKIGITACSKACGIQRQTGLKLVRRLGILNSREEKIIIRRQLKKKTQDKSGIYDENFKFNQPYQIYILGLLWGDGYFNEQKRIIRIECLKTDLEEVKYLFKKLGKWTEIISNRDNRKPTLVLSINDYESYQLFKNLGYNEKSKHPPEKLLDTIPENLHPYFWRGYFDADGCHANTQIKFTSCYEQNWKCVQQLFNKLGMTYSIRRKLIKLDGSQRNSFIASYTKENVFKFYCYIYGPHLEHFGFSRKQKKFNKFLKKYNFIPNEVQPGSQSLEEVAKISKTSSLPFGICENPMLGDACHLQTAT